jgi:hypothetical protein
MVVAPAEDLTFLAEDAVVVAADDQPLRGWESSDLDRSQGAGEVLLSELSPGVAPPAADPAIIQASAAMAIAEAYLDDSSRRSLACLCRSHDEEPTAEQAGEEARVQSTG